MNSVEISSLLAIVKEKYVCCPLCQRQSVVTFFNAPALIMVDSENAIEVIVGSCDNCGYIMQFDIKTLKELSKSSHDDE